MLKLEAVDGVPPTSERALRGVVSAVDWAKQRVRWVWLGLWTMPAFAFA